MPDHQEAIPEDIKAAVLQSFLIPRFTRIYHEGIFRDSTGKHTLRCVEIANSLNLSEIDTLKLERMLWIHDLAEIVTSDYSVVQKQSDPDLSTDVNKREAQAAIMILSEPDQKLFNEFNEGLTPIALIAKTIDRIEGNMYFHRELVCWINSTEYIQSHIPKYEALQYSFEYHAKSVAALSLLPDLEIRYKQTIQSLLKVQARTICKVWKTVPENKIPVPIKSRLPSIKV